MPLKDKKADDQAAVIAAIADMPEKDRIVGEKLHALITTNAPDLLPRTWYGMPAYHNGSKIVCFFRSGKKFGERYMTLGFNDVAKLDAGNMWPISFALQQVDSDDEKRIVALLKKCIK